MKVIGYARVSSREQAEGRSIENQIALLKSAGAEEVLVDVESAYSTKRDRPNFNKLMELVRSGLVSKVLVCTLDRLSRNEAVTFIAFEDFERSHCQLVSLEENFDLNTPDGRLQAGFTTLMARNYSARLSQKTKRGHKARRDRNASYFKLFGYQIEDERYKLDHTPFLCLLENKAELSRAAIASDIIEIFKASKSIRKTLHTLNTKYGLLSFSSKGKGNRAARDRFHFSIGGLHSWLTNPILRGHTAYNRSQQQHQHHKHLWDMRYDTHQEDRLITDADYKELDNIFNWNKDHHGFNNESKVIHPLSGLVYCGECGRSHRVMGSLSRDKITKIYYYQCQNYGVRACDQKTTIRHCLVEEIAIACLIQRAEQIADIAAAPLEDSEPLELRELKNQLAALETLSYNVAIAQAKEQIKTQIRNIQYQSTKSSEVDNDLRALLITTFSDRLYFETLQPTEKRLIYRALIDQIIVKDGLVSFVQLKDGFKYEPPKPVVPPLRPINNRKPISIGSKLIVCSVNGDRIDGEVIEIFGKYNVRRLRILFNGREHSFDRRSGKEVVDGKIPRPIQFWLELPN